MPSLSKTAGILYGAEGCEVGRKAELAGFSRKYMPQNYAVIDIGTLKVKLLIARVLASGQIEEIYSSNTLTCFGCDMDKNQGYVFEENLQKTIEEIKRCKGIIEKYNVSKTRIVSTHAMRRAKNKEEILNKILAETGFLVENISQEEEAVLFFSAVARGFKDFKENHAVIDVGGGSVQILIGNENGISSTHTMQTGAQYLHDNFTEDSSNPESFTTEEDIEKMKHYILKQLFPVEKSQGVSIVYGSSNIIDLMKAIRLPLESSLVSASHPYKTYSKYLSGFVREVLPLKYCEREAKYPFQKGYMWGIDKAFLNVVEISKHLESTYIIPSNANIAKGIIYSRLA